MTIIYRVTLGKTREPSYRSQYISNRSLL